MFWVKASFVFALSMMCAGALMQDWAKDFSPASRPWLVAASVVFGEFLYAYYADWKEKHA